MADLMSNNLYIYGCQNYEIPSHKNFGKFILDKLKKYKNRIAIEQVDGEKIDFTHLVKYSILICNHLKKIGIGPGDTVALGMEIRKEYIPCMFGIILTGATFTPIEILCGKSCLKHKLKLSEPKYFILTQIYWDMYVDTLKSIERVKYMGFDFDLNATPRINSCFNTDVDEDDFEPTLTKLEDVAYILYSSGTTGLPKGVLLTNLNCILSTLPDELCEEGINSVLCSGEWYHNYTAFKSIKLLLAGKRIVFHPNFSLEMIPHIVMKCKIDLALCIPSHVQYLSKMDPKDFDLSSLKIIYSRSSPLHERTIQELKLRIPTLQKVFQGYGMTEAGEPTSQMRSSSIKPGSVGRPCRGIIMKVVDLNTNQLLGPNCNGEIRLKGDVLMKGYKGVDRNKYLDEHGFFKTGDLGYYDEQYDFFIIDRIKEIICYDGNKIAPLELETLLLLHPEVKEVGVVGKPDHNKVELPTAFVVKHPKSKITEKELVDYVATEVTDYKQLRGGVIFIETLPRSTRGKILRRELRDMLKKYY